MPPSVNAISPSWRAGRYFMNQQSTLVNFRVTCTEPRAWLVVTRDRRKPRVVEMQQPTPSIWTVSAELPPGEYHCRYYCGDNRHVNYFGAAHIEGSIACGMDALVTVRPPAHDMATHSVQ
jgi:hypothetical protein